MTAAASLATMNIGDGAPAKEPLESGDLGDEKLGEGEEDLGFLTLGEKQLIARAERIVAKSSEWLKEYDEVLTAFANVSRTGGTTENQGGGNGTQQGQKRKAGPHTDGSMSEKRQRTFRKIMER